MNRIFTIIIGSIFLVGLVGFAYNFTPNTAVAPGTPIPSAPAETGTTPLPSSTDVSVYVSENISTLSTEPEVLGGTFFVTAIASANGSGVVSYEDGHNAYTADFTYSMATDGSVSIDSFVVRPL